MSDFAASGIMYAGEQSHEDDKRLFVTFSYEQRLDRKASDEAGRNIYKDVEYITARIPGDKTTSIHRPVMASDKIRFPLQYAAFKNSSGEQIVGTPLSLWPGIRPSQAKELEYFNVRTVEQLAAMPDGNAAASMMGVSALRRSAQEYVKAAKEAAPLLKVQKELEERDNTISALKDQIEKQGDVLSRLAARLDDKPAKTVKEK